jgi:hypothetical protein
MNDNVLPPGWDENQLHRVLDHYEKQTDEEAAAEDEEGFDRATHTVMEVPFELVPAVRDLISKRKAV